MAEIPPNLIDPQAPGRFTAAFFGGLKHQATKGFVARNVVAWLKRQPDASVAVTDREMDRLSAPPAWLAGARARGDKIARFAPSAEIVAELENLRTLLRDIERTAAAKDPMDGMREEAQRRLGSLIKATVEDLGRLHDGWFERAAKRQGSVARRRTGAAPDPTHAGRVDLDDGRFWLPLPAGWLKTAGQRLSNCLARGFYGDAVAAGQMEVWGLFSGEATDDHLLGAARFMRGSKDEWSYQESQAWKGYDKAEFNHSLAGLCQTKGGNFTVPQAGIFDGRHLDDFDAYPVGDAVLRQSGGTLVLSKADGTNSLVTTTDGGRLKIIGVVNAIAAVAGSPEDDALFGDLLRLSLRNGPPVRETEGLVAGRFLIQGPDVVDLNARTPEVRVEQADTVFEAHQIHGGVGLLSRWRLGTQAWEAAEAGHSIYSHGGVERHMRSGQVLPAAMASRLFVDLGRVLPEQDRLQVRSMAAASMAAAAGYVTLIGVGAPPPPPAGRRDVKVVEGMFWAEGVWAGDGEAGFRRLDILPRILPDGVGIWNPERDLPEGAVSQGGLDGSCLASFEGLTVLASRTDKGDLALVGGITSFEGVRVGRAANPSYAGLARAIERDMGQRLNDEAMQALGLVRMAKGEIVAASPTREGPGGTPIASTSKRLTIFRPDGSPLCDVPLSSRRLAAAGPIWHPAPGEGPRPPTDGEIKVFAGVASGLGLACPQAFGTDRFMVDVLTRRLDALGWSTVGGVMMPSSQTAFRPFVVLPEEKASLQVTVTLGKDGAWRTRGDTHPTIRETYEFKVQGLPSSERPGENDKTWPCHVDGSGAIAFGYVVSSLPPDAVALAVAALRELCRRTGLPLAEQAYQEIAIAPDEAGLPQALAKDHLRMAGRLETPVGTWRPSHEEHRAKQHAWWELRSVDGLTRATSGSELKIPLRGPDAGGPNPPAPEAIFAAWMQLQAALTERRLAPPLPVRILEVSNQAALGHDPAAEAPLDGLDGEDALPRP